MSYHSEKAEALFRDGYNCSQAVAVAFCDITGLDESEIMRLSSSFGGGFGRSREVCGAVSGGCLVLGALYGDYNPTDGKGKAEHYALIREFMGEFKTQAGGSYICRELLGGTATVGGEPSKRTDEFYSKRPCPSLVALAAEIIDGIIENKSRENTKEALSI